MSTFLTVAFPFTVSAQQECRELFARGDTITAAQPYLSARYGNVQKPLMQPHFRAPARLVLTKFAAQKNFHSANTSSWLFNGLNYTFEGAAENHQLGFPDEMSIFAEQQDFSLGKMVETDYLKPSEANVFRADGLKRETGQVSFLEVVHDAADDELQKIYGESRHLKYGNTHTRGVGGDLSVQPVKTAALYTVSGQVWSRSSATKQLALPWENEPSRKDQALDRKKYKYVWEWGRAAQDIPGEIAPLYAAAAFLNYVELRAHGGDLDDAYVMVHSFDKLNTRLYSRMHPGTIYPTGWKDPNDTLFLVPLRDALEKYPASTVSEHVSEIIKLAGGKITNKQAIDILVDNKIWRWNELDFYIHDRIQSSPIILNDMSKARSVLTLFSLAALGLDHETCETIGRYLVRIDPLLHSGNLDSKYLHAADSVFTSAEYLHSNAVEISNLNPKIAKLDPNYTVSVLFSAFTYYHDQLSRALSEAYRWPLAKADQYVTDWMLRNQIKFGVTTGAPEVERQLSFLHPSHVSEHLGTDTTEIKPDKTLLENEPYAYHDSRLYFFTAEQIRTMILKHPDFYGRYGGLLRAGTWRTQYLSSQTDLL